MINEHETLQVYDKIRKGMPSGVPAWKFVLGSANQIKEVSVRQCAESLGLTEFPTKAFGEVGEILLAEVKNKRVDEGGNFISGSLTSVNQIANYRAGEIDRANLDGFIESLGLETEDDDALTFMQNIQFGFFVEFVLSRISEASEYGEGWKSEQVIELVNEDIKGYDQEYKDRLLPILNNSLQSDKNLTEGEQKVVTGALYLANYIWQVANVCRFAAEVQEKGNSTRLAKTAFASFDDMLDRSYKEHIANGKSQEDALLLTAFKLFQDGVEFIQPNRTN